MGWILACLLCAAALAAQDRVVLADGGELRGRILAETGTALVLRTEEGGIVRVERAAVRELLRARPRLEQGLGAVAAVLWPATREGRLLVLGLTLLVAVGLVQVGCRSLEIPGRGWRLLTVAGLLVALGGGACVWGLQAANLRTGLLLASASVTALGTAAAVLLRTEWLRALALAFFLHLTGAVALALVVLCTLGALAVG